MNRKVIAFLLVLPLLVGGCALVPWNTPTPPAVVSPSDAPSDPGPAEPADPTAPEGPEGSGDPTEPGGEPTDPGDPTEVTGSPQPDPEPQRPAGPPVLPAGPPVVRREMPNPVRGLLVTGWYAGSPDLVWPLLDWAKAAGLNTIVVDLKAEDGYVSWNADVPLAHEIGAIREKIRDMPAFIKEAKRRGFWVAGRIVVMNDQFLYKARPEWGIPGFSGGPYSFMDPANENVWQYNIDIAKAAIKAGVDEIQWDYIRYPEKLVEGYNKNTTPEYRVGNITAFLRRSMEELKPLGVVVGADLFGLTTSVAEGDDMEIGQDYYSVAQIVDYVSPMAYPSHYHPGTYGLPDPNAAPYETVWNSMNRAIERSPGIPLEKHRPWIQDFSLGGITYGAKEVAAQVRALKDLGIESFMLWDPSCRFTRDIDYNTL